MNKFSALLEALAFQPQRNAKLRLMTDYFRTTPDPDRGYALGALTGGLKFSSAKPALVRGLVEARVDPILFAMSYDYVGDLAETVALIWPPRHGANIAPTLGEIVETLRLLGKTEIPRRLEKWLDALDPDGRLALIKLITGGLRVGVSARLAKTALAELKPVDANEIEDLWPALTPPYADLFAWLEGRADKPAKARAVFRPAMLAHAIEETDWANLAPDDFAAEWKWDGIRVQAVSEAGVKRLYSRTGEDVGGAFPDVLAALPDEAVIDGELLVMHDDGVATFNELQQRLNRKAVTEKMLNAYPAGIRAYDLLMLEGEDLRGHPFIERRRKLESVIAGLRPPARLDLSPLITFSTWEELAAQRAAPPSPAIEGVMLKRKQSAYLAGRVKGEWWKWKRDPHLVDAVLMYAQRGHGKRSSFYSDYTFGVWKGDELVPVGKAYFGFTDEEIARIDRFVRDNTTNKFGPVREVTHDRKIGLVFEVAFEGLARSPRHKSGIAMRFPRINRLRWDKPPGDADTIDSLERMLPPEQMR